MKTKSHKFNFWKLMQYSGFGLLVLGLIFAFSAFKVTILLYFGLVLVLIGAINLFIYYLFLGTRNPKKYMRKQDNSKFELAKNK